VPEKKEPHKFHSRNYHQGRYDLKVLVLANPALSEHLVQVHGKQTIRFSDPSAVKELNRAKIPRGPQFLCLDVGTGANCIYPIVGRKVYKWSFIGSETNKAALASAEKIISTNNVLTDKVILRHQPDPKKVLSGIIQADDYIDLTICNPPFHSSAEEAAKANQKKNKGLDRSKTKQKAGNTKKNFGGQHSELWYQGSELAFVSKMITESQSLKTNCFLYSSLISQKKNILILQAKLDSCGARFHAVIDIQHGNKISRLLAWSYLTDKQMKVWAKTRWS